MNNLHDHLSPPTQKEDLLTPYLKKGSPAGHNGEETGKLIALFVSEISNPIFIAIPTFLLIALRSAPSLGLALLWWSVTVIGISLAPLLFIARGVRCGVYTDRHVSRREQRFVPLLFGMVCVMAVFLVLLLLHASLVLIATMTAVIVVGVIATTVTRFWTKISLHLVGIAGTATVFTLLFGMIAVLLYPFIFLVAWARWRVQAHTIFQACAGAILAVVVTFVVFWLFGLGF